MKNDSPAWIPCDCCEEYLCTIHQGQHVSECDCPPIDEWTVNPYEESPAMTTKDRQAAHKARQIALGRVRRPVYATPEEHEKIKQMLKEIRA